jgi:methylamine dehydrogenase heavy chain
MQIRPLLLACVLVLTARGAMAAIPEDMGVTRLPAPGPHWFWADDFTLFNDIDGRSFLIDADSGKLLGMLATGVVFGKIDLPRDYHVIYSAETYYSRGSRGERTDVVSYYDPATLEFTGEVVIPPRRQTGLLPASVSGLTDGDRFMLIYNFNPAQSVTVVDVGARKVAGELTTPGCALVYPSGPGRFGQLCQDGRWQTIELKDDGTEAKRSQSDAFFDPQKDPITEKGVRLGDRWYFASRGGQMYEVDVSKAAPSFGKAWPLLSDADRAASWTIGGHQHLAVHARTGRLYSLMHQGGVDTHKDPGTEIWVYDLAKHARVQKITLAHPAISIETTQDDAPVLLTATASPILDVYEAASGKLVRTIEGIGQTPLLLHTMPVMAH